MEEKRMGIDPESATVLSPLPTELGDVLILRSTESYTVYAVGAVVQSGQADFGHQTDVCHVTTHADAVRRAHAVVAPNGHIYLVDIDTQE